MSLAPEPAEPSWLQRYVCPQCPREIQPRRGFDVVEFQDHAFGHALNALREAAEDARLYRNCLEMIDSEVGEKSEVAWERVNVFGHRHHLRHLVDTALRRDASRVEADPRASDPNEERVRVGDLIAAHADRDRLAALVADLIMTLPKCDQCGVRPVTRDVIAVRLCDECTSPIEAEFIGEPVERPYARPLRAFFASRAGAPAGAPTCDAGARPARMDAPGGPVCGCGRPSRHESGWCGLPRAEGGGE